MVGPRRFAAAQSLLPVSATHCRRRYNVAESCALTLRPSRATPRLLPLASVQDRPAFNLRGALASWNLLLTVFSLAGFLRTMPHLVHSVLSDEAGLAHGFYASVCRPAETSFGQGANGLWTMLFIFSKVPELLDTAFLVLHKKPVHFTVLLYCWHSYMTRSSAGLYFVAMNYGASLLAAHLLLRTLP